MRRNKHGATIHHFNRMAKTFLPLMEMKGNKLIKLEANIFGLFIVIDDDDAKLFFFLNAELNAMWKRETCKNARNECVIHVTLRGASPKLDHWWGLGMYPSDAMYASLSSRSFYTMLMRVTSCASCHLCCCVVLSMCVLRVVWISCVVCSRSPQRRFRFSIPWVRSW